MGITNISVWKIDLDSIQPLVYSESDLDALTLLLPPGLYTTFRTYGHKTRILGLRAHLARLYTPAAKQRVRVARSVSELRRLMVRLIESLDFDELRIRLVLDLSDKPGTLYLLALPLQTPSLEVYSRGVRVAITEINRLTPQLKRTTFISETSKERDEKGADEYEILLTHNRLIREGMTSNFFYVRGRRLYTAGRDVLKGVTRRTVIALARSAGMIVSYNALTLDAIPSIEEAFITSSSRGIVPVVQIGDQWVGEGRVGPVTRQLSMEYETRVLEMAEVIA